MHADTAECRSRISEGEPAECGSYLRNNAVTATPRTARRARGEKEVPGRGNAVGRRQALTAQATRVLPKGKQ
eukprot:6213449-Pleurochrysis_carterae.AAC.2